MAAALPYLPLLVQAPGIIDGFTNSARNCWQTYEDISSNAPAAKYEALKKARKESDEAHKESMKNMQELNKNVEKAAKDQIEAADRRINEQKKLNNAELEEMRKLNKENEEIHYKNMQKMKEEHAARMRTIQSENREERERVEKGHREKMNLIEKDHKEEKKKAQEKVEQARVEGEKKIQEAKKEKEEVTKQRQEALTFYNQEMKKLTEENNKQLQKVREETNQMRIKNSEEKRLQLEETNRLTLEGIQKTTADLISHLRLETNREYVTKFRALTATLTEMRNSLVNVQQECLPGTGTQSIQPGVLDPDFEKLTSQKDLYQSRLKSYHQFVINASHVHPEIYKTCQSHITEMSGLIGNENLSSLLRHLPRAIDNYDSDHNEHYGNIAKDLNIAFQTLCDSMDSSLVQLTSAHLQEDQALSTEEKKAIDNK